MKIVINRCYGGFGLSAEAKALYAKERGFTEDFYDGDLDRADPVLVRVVETLDSKANGPFADLRIVEIEAGTFYRINEYDGMESIEYANNIDWKIAS